MQVLSTYMAKNWCSRCVHDASLVAYIKDSCCAIFAEVSLYGLPDEWVNLEGKGINCTMFSSQEVNETNT